MLKHIVRWNMLWGVGLLFATHTVCGSVIRVDHESTTNGPGTASNWSNAFDNLQDAMEAAGAGVSIWVADGTYYPTEPINPTYPRTACFNMHRDVKIYGGFQGLSRTGGGETQLSQRNSEAYETILSGNIGDPGDPDDNAFHVVRAEGSSIDDAALLSGFTIRDGLSSGEGNDHPGGGMVILGGAYPVVSRCSFINNHNGVYLVDEPEGPVQFLACTFIENISFYHGGAVFCQMDGEQGAEVWFINCLAYDNFASSTGAFIYSDASSTFVNCTVTRNYDGATDSGSGGAIRINGSGTSVVANCLLYGNENEDGFTEGAQLNNSGLYPLTVRNSLIQDLDDYAGDGNIVIDPSFVNSSSDDFRILYSSHLLNNGDATDVPADAYDIDDDSDTSEPLPDRFMQDRQINPGDVTDCVDIGAFEEQTAGTCTGDITGASGVPDGTVGMPDLLLVIERWNLPGGAADLVGTGACGDSYVDGADLLELIGNWGSCSSGGSLPQGVTDCMEECEEAPDYQGCMDECLKSL
jgi:hypothetical protein